MNKYNLLTYEKLKSLLHYNPDTGLFTWRERGGDTVYTRIFNNVYANKETGHLWERDGYKRVYLMLTLNGDPYHFFAHRLAWFYVTSEWPEDQVDHINGDSTDNRFVNLREVDNQENCKNTKLCKNNSSGFNGVSWHKSNKNWSAYIMVDRKKIHLGGFKDKQDAISARKQANIKYGYHENHGRQ